MSTTYDEFKLRSTAQPPSISLDQLPKDKNTSVLNQGDDNLNEFATIDLNGTNGNSNTSNAHSTTSVTDLNYTSFDNAAVSINSIANPTPLLSYSNTSSPHQNKNMSPTSTSSFCSSSVAPSISAISSSPTSIITSASETSSRLASKTVSTLDHLKSWSKSAYKCTRQMLNEKLGKCARTIDPEIENSIEQIRETRRKYENILTLANSMTTHFRDVVHSQRLLAENFGELSQKSSELIDEFTLSCETQRQLVKHGEVLLESLNQFTSSLRTLCHKTMEDTLITVRHYEAARLEYDAYKVDLEALKTGAAAAVDANSENVQQKELEVDELRRKYEQFRSDVAIKIRFLNENRLNVMRKQLVLFQQVLNAYFSENSKALGAIMKQFESTQLREQHNSEKLQSFLEKN